MPGASGEQLTQEVNEATAVGSGSGAPDGYLALVLGVEAAATTTMTKDLAGSTLCGAALSQRDDRSVRDGGLAYGVVVGVHAAVDDELEWRSPVRD